jgi:major vault protein
VVPEGFYVVLMNPTKDPKAQNEGHPQEGTVSTAPELSIGHKVVIPGPTMFALWPGQHAKIVRGHSLRSNEYLLGRVYNEQEARNNWSKATVAAASAGSVGA